MIKEFEKIDKFINLLENSGVGELIIGDDIIALVCHVSLKYIE